MKLLLTHPALLIAPLFLLSGCQLLEFKKNPAASADTSRIEVARRLEAKGHYGQAIGVLEEAIARDGKAESYTQALLEIRLKQIAMKQELQDELLISQTSALKNDIPILEQLLYSDPEQKIYAKQLKQTRRQLQQLRKPLSECGWRHFKENNALAKDCLSLALSLEPNEQDQRLMAHMLKEHKQNLKKIQTGVRVKRERAWKHRNQQRLEEAHRLQERGQLTEARQVLKTILKEAPRNDSAKMMLHDIEKRLNHNIENLLAAGDHLYREGEIEGAKATWRAALSLDPQDRRAREKIDRAQRVLDNLENLRNSEPQRPDH